MMEMEIVEPTIFIPIQNNYEEFFVPHNCVTIPQKGKFQKGKFQKVGSNITTIWSNLVTLPAGHIPLCIFDN